MRGLVSFRLAYVYVGSLLYWRFFMLTEMSCSVLSGTLNATVVI